MFDRQRSPATPRLAASVILLRETGGRLQVLLLRRHKKSSFMSDAFVFPGGALDPGESVERAATRELFEEASVSLDEHALHYWSRWITPSVEPKRFDATFFIAQLPEGQSAKCDNRETTEQVWVTPAEGLRRHREGTLKLPPPQLRTLYEIGQLAPSGYAAVVAAAHARAREPFAILPRFCQLESQIALLFPWDSAYADQGVGGSLPVPAGVAWAIGPSRVILADMTWRLEEIGPRMDPDPTG